MGQQYQQLGLPVVANGMVLNAFSSAPSFNNQLSQPSHYQMEASSLSINVQNETDDFITYHPIETAPDLGHAVNTPAPFTPNKSIENENDMINNRFNSLDFYVNSYPTDFNSINLFKNEWSSILPGELAAFGGGSQLFDDSRVKYWVNKISEYFPVSLSNPSLFNVLELGPLEGGHTFMLSKNGWNITAIESNARAFLKCLITANIYKTNAKFLLGNFERFFESDNIGKKIDFILASGVLYHLKKPTESLRLMLNHCNSIGIWTHYITDDFIKQQPNRWKEEIYRDEVANESIQGWKQYYNEGLENPGFCGGGQDFSIWLKKEQILSTLDLCGFSYDIKATDETSPSGPNITLFAARKLG